jgi:hypothetical protein
MANCNPTVDEYLNSVLAELPALSNQHRQEIWLELLGHLQDSAADYGMVLAADMPLPVHLWERVGAAQTLGRYFRAVYQSSQGGTMSGFMQHRNTWLVGVGTLLSASLCLLGLALGDSHPLSELLLRLVPLGLLSTMWVLYRQWQPQHPRLAGLLLGIGLLGVSGIGAWLPAFWRVGWGVGIVLWFYGSSWLGQRTGTLPSGLNWLGTGLGTVWLLYFVLAWLNPYEFADPHLVSSRFAFEFILFFAGQLLWAGWLAGLLWRGNLQPRSVAAVAAPQA